MKFSGLMLDFGGVILKTPFELHQIVEKKLNIPAGTLDWFGPFNPKSDLLWQKMQKDKITEQDYWREKSKWVGSIIGENWTLRDYMTCCYHDVPENMIIRKELRQLVYRVKNNFSIGILTNEIEYFHGREWMDNLEILKIMDYLIDGSNTKVLKPNIKAYKIAIEASGLDPKEIIFIDDQIRNVRGAQKTGLHAIQFDVQNPSRIVKNVMQLFDLS